MSNNLFISFELSEQNEEQEKFQKLLAALGNSTPLLNNCWYINSPYNAEEALKILGRAMVKEDKLVIANTATDSVMWAGLEEREARRIRQNWKMSLNKPKLAS